MASNLTQDQQKALGEMKFWDRDKNIIIRPYDKGHGFFIEYKSSYKARILEELNSDLYVYIIDKASMFTEVLDAIKVWICNWQNESLLTPTLQEWITPDGTKKPGNIYMNYKRHKPDQNFPGRLITSGVGSFTENLSSLVALELKPLVEQLPHVLVDTNHLLRKIAEMNANNIITSDMDIIHVSWDVVAMFPSIPETLGLSKCRELLDKRQNVEGLPTECVIEALKICLNYNISSFDNEWYRQVRGAAMGPHEACFYCDIAMSYYDEIVNSDNNPCKKPLLWWRFRDDIYDPWPHGQTELHKFTDWLNSLDENVQFTLKYTVNHGVDVLDNHVYDKDGKTHTSLFSKPSDTHAYLPPTSCHPYHIVKNNPNQIARRVRKISSEDTTYSTTREKFSTLLAERGYSETSIEEAFSNFDEVYRATLYHPKSTKLNDKRKKCFPLVSEFNPHLPPIPPVLHKYKYLLEMDPVVNAAIPPNSIFASYRQPKSILDILVHSKFQSSETNSTNSSLGCKSCNNCFLCKYYLMETETFKSYHCETEFRINKNLTCNSEGVIYLIQDILCQRSYTGSTIDNTKDRMSNYKNHFKINHKGCEMAQHFHECGADIHSLYSDAEANTRSKAFQNKYDEHLSRQIKIIIIDQVDLSSAETTREKRVLIEEREGYWQTQLRTLLHYGGLNKKDERKISNKRSANKFKVAVSSGTQSTPNPTPTPVNPHDISCNPTRLLDHQDTTCPPQPTSHLPNEPPSRRSSRLHKSK